MDILPQLLVNAVITGSIYALVAAGFALTYGLLKVLNFAHGHLMMAGAYIFYGMLNGMWVPGYGMIEGVPFATAIGLTALLSAGLGVLTMVVFVTPFERYSHMLPLVSTIALAVILESVVAMEFGVNVKALDSGSAAQSLEFGPVFVTPLQMVIVVSAVVVLVGLAILIHASSFGRKVRALSELSSGAQALSIDAPRLKLVVFVLGTLLSVYAGVLIGFETNLQPTMGHGYTLKALAAMILGGLGNLWGTILGCYILGLVENLGIGLDLGSYSLPAGYKDAFGFSVILVVLLLRPEGLVSRRRRTA